MYIPIGKYPVNYRDTANVNKYTNENVIQKPVKTIINRPSIEFRRSPQLIRPQTASYQLPKETYKHRPVPVITSTAAPTTVRSHFDSPIQEYLLHAQMPLPNAKTFIMINRGGRVEPEFLT